MSVALAALCRLVTFYQLQLQHAHTILGGKESHFGGKEITLQVGAMDV
jgi:hypothetical protein